MSGVSIRQVHKKTATRKLANNKLDLVAVQEVREDNGGSETADDYTFFYMEMGMIIITWEEAFFYIRVSN